MHVCIYIICMWHGNGLLQRACSGGRIVLAANIEAVTTANNALTASKDVPT